MAIVNPVYSLTEIKPSAVHALGIFAKVDIPKGTVWWRVEENQLIHLTRFHYETIAATPATPMVDALLASFLHHGYFVKRFDAILFIPDTGRFTNHSSTPNSMVCPDSNGLCSMANRDISAGEEIFENYALYDKCPWAKMYGEFGKSIGCW